MCGAGWSNSQADSQASGRGVADVKRWLTVGGPANARSMTMGLRWPHFGLTATLNVAAHRAQANSIPPGQRSYALVGEMPETLYGSEGWGFESLRARPGQQPIAILRRPLLLPKWPSSGPEQPRT